MTTIMVLSIKNVSSLGQYLNGTYTVPPCTTGGSYARMPYEIKMINVTELEL